MTNFVYIGNLLKCASFTNKSPIPQINTPVYFGLNQNYFNTLGALDDPIENDEFHFRQIAGNNEITIDTTPVNMKNITIFGIPSYCIPQKSGFCSPKPKLNPPVGFYLDSLTGQVIFHTAVNGYFVNSIQILEFRRNTKNQLVRIGTSMYEAHY
jgi:hypothetical protein